MKKGSVWKIYEILNNPGSEYKLGTSIADFDSGLLVNVEIFQVTKIK
jgi:hypothetical protein